MQEHHTQQPMAEKEHLDPVCGMTVEESPSAITYDYKGTKYFFCSQGCRRAFEKEPDKYLNEGPSMQM